MQSPMLLWVHLAPVCGTASRARDILRFDGDPKPLRSNSFLEGLPELDEGDRARVELANLLFQCACEILLTATNGGSCSHGWITRRIHIFGLLAGYWSYLKLLQPFLVISRPVCWVEAVTNGPG